MGGLSRRNTVIAAERAKGDVVVVDGGGSLMVAQLGPKLPAGTPVVEGTIRDLEQRRVKAQLIGESFAIGGMDAMALNAADWTLGTDFVRGLVADQKLPVLAANLTCGGTAPFPASTVVTRGGRKVGIVGVTAGTVEGCEVTDPVAALQAAVAALGPVDFVLGLVPLDNKALGAVAEAKLPFDAVIGATGGHSVPAPTPRGELWVYEAGSRGKQVGVLEVRFVPGSTDFMPSGLGDAATARVQRTQKQIDELTARIDKEQDPTRKEQLGKQREALEKKLGTDQAQADRFAQPANTGTLANREVDLGADLADEPRTAALVTAAKTKINADLALANPLMVARNNPDPTSPYAGSDTCARCHDAEFAQWSRTGHAKALAGLVQANRVGDGDCWSCHVTGANAAGGVAGPTAIGALRDVQCEACHGPSRAHAADPTHVDAIRTPDGEVCTTCHDGVRDQGRFDHTAYWAKIVHTAEATPEVAAPAK